jgi:integration host factor subunit alpha
MAGHTVTRAELAEAVFREVGLSRNECAKLVESVLELVAESVAKGTTVKISSFGSFSIRSKGRRIGRNPKTGHEVPIMPRKVLVFHASHVLKDRINKGEDARSAEAAAVTTGSEKLASTAAPERT